MLYEENELAQALGLSSGSPAASGVSIDSRTLEKGDAFFALKGERFDANQFVEQAFERGAACAIVSQGISQGVSQGISQISPSLSDEATRNLSGRMVEVEDVEQALVRCGCYARGRTSARIVAITGSLGKTSLRTMLQELLPGKVSASRGNLNNHIGVPLSLARMARDCNYGVFELGMNHAGEIAKLSAWVRAHVGVITSIAAVHSEFFKDELEICDAKGELLDWVSDVALLPASEPYASRLRAKAEAAGIPRLAFFGSEEGSDYVLQKHQDSLDPRDDSVSVRATFPDRANPDHASLDHANPDDANSDDASDATAQGQRNLRRNLRRNLQWQVGGRGYARALGSLCALAVCDLQGLVPDLRSKERWKDLLTCLAHLRPPRGRGRVARLSLSQPLRHIRLIDESYNASPQAVRNAFAVLARFPPRRLAALGDMLELGAEGERLHAELASDAERCCDLVFTCGTLSKKLYKALPRHLRGTHSDDVAALTTTLHSRLKDGDTLLVKGSLGSRMATAVSCLEQRAVGIGY